MRVEYSVDKEYWDNHASTEVTLEDPGDSIEPENCTVCVNPSATVKPTSGCFSCPEPNPYENIPSVISFELDGEITGAAVQGDGPPNFVQSLIHAHSKEWELEDTTEGIGNPASSGTLHNPWFQDELMDQMNLAFRASHGVWHQSFQPLRCDWASNLATYYVNLDIQDSLETTYQIISLDNPDPTILNACATSGPPSQYNATWMTKVATRVPLSESGHNYRLATYRPPQNIADLWAVRRVSSQNPDMGPNLSPEKDEDFQFSYLRYQEIFPEEMASLPDEFGPGFVDDPASSFRYLPRPEVLAGLSMPVQPDFGTRAQSAWRIRTAGWYGYQWKFRDKKLHLLAAPKPTTMKFTITRAGATRWELRFGGQSFLPFIGADPFQLGGFLGSSVADGSVQTLFLRCPSFPPTDPRVPSYIQHFENYGRGQEAHDIYPLIDGVDATLFPTNGGRWSMIRANAGRIGIVGNPDPLLTDPAIYTSLNHPLHWPGGVTEYLEKMNPEVGYVSDGPGRRINFGNTAENNNFRDVFSDLLVPPVLNYPAGNVGVHGSTLATWNVNLDCTVRDCIGYDLTLESSWNDNSGVGVSWFPNSFPTTGKLFFSK
jgi:hypothetical protein